MAQRQRKWARQKRDELFLWLGGYCVDCGETKDLEFDIINPVGNYHHRAMEWSWRMSFYRHHFMLGNLALRCTRCNSSKGNSVEEIEVPF